MYSDGRIFITRDNGGVWTEIDNIIGEEVAGLAVGSSSLFAVTKSGKLFSRPIN